MHEKLAIAFCSKNRRFNQTNRPKANRQRRTLDFVPDPSVLCRTSHYSPAPHFPPGGLAGRWAGAPGPFCRRRVGAGRRRGVDLPRRVSLCAAPEGLCCYKRASDEDGSMDRRPLRATKIAKDAAKGHNITPST